MKNNIKDLMNRLNDKDNKIRKEALDKLIELTEDTVDWTYDYWDYLVAKLNSDNSYQRTIGMLILSNLAKSDDENRFKEILDKYLSITEDERFITSRQALQNLWKVAIVNSECRYKIIKHLENMFINNKYLKTHANLIRKDVIESICKIYEENSEEVDLDFFRMKIDENCDKKERKILLDIINE